MGGWIRRELWHRVGGPSSCQVGVFDATGKAMARRKQRPELGEGSRRMAAPSPHSGARGGCRLINEGLITARPLPGRVGVGEDGNENNAVDGAVLEDDILPHLPRIGVEASRAVTTFEADDFAPFDVLLHTAEMIRTSQSAYRC